MTTMKQKHQATASQCCISAHSTDSADSAQPGQGFMQASTAQSQPQPFNGATDMKAKVQCVLGMLQEIEQRDNISIHCKASIESLGSQTVWECCVAACNAPGNSTRVFCKLLAQKNTEQKVKYVQLYLVISAYIA